MGDHAQIQDGDNHLEETHRREAEIALFEYHDDSVTFNSSTSDVYVYAASFYVTDFSITSGQDPDGRNRKGSHAQSTSYTTYNVFNFSVGRHASGTVADFFNGKIATSENTFNHGAGELNFAFLGTLVLQMNKQFGATKALTFQNACLAQGHSAGKNNWWFGIKGASSDGEDKIKATSSQNYAVTFQRGGLTNPVDTVTVTKISPALF